MHLNLPSLSIMSPACFKDSEDRSLTIPRLIFLRDQSKIFTHNLHPSSRSCSSAFSVGWGWISLDLCSSGDHEVMLSVHLFDPLLMILESSGILNQIWQWQTLSEMIKSLWVPGKSLPALRGFPDPLLEKKTGRAQLLSILSGSIQMANYHTSTSGPASALSCPAGRPRRLGRRHGERCGVGGSKGYGGELRV